MDPSLKLVEPTYRSASEKRLASEIMSLEGSWDEATQTYRTRECVLQRRTQVLSKLHLTLRVNPALQYQLQSADRNFVYPQAPRELLRKHRIKPSQLTDADPNPANIDRCASVASERRSRPTPLAPSRVGTDDAISELEQALLDEARNVLGDEGFESLPSAARHRGGAATVDPRLTPVASGGIRTGAGNQTPIIPAADRTSSTDATPRRKERGNDEECFLPNVGSAGPYQYSSMLVELQTTSRNLRSRGRQFSALQSILDLDATAELKRTITKMFAEPGRAKDISQEEYDRREKRHVDDKKAQNKQQLNLLMEERALLEKELAMLR